MNNLSAFFGKLMVGVLLSLFLTIPHLATAQLAAPTNLQAVLIDDLLGIVELSWDLPPDTSFQFTLIKVNGAAIGTNSMPCPCNFLHHLSAYGTTCFTVQAFYDQGFSDPVTTCIDWLPPEIMINPSSCYMSWLYTGDMYQWVTTISNLGNSSLSFSFPGFDTGSPPPGYIVNVSPATAIIPPGGSHEVTIFWDATGYGPGIYPQDLLCESNDPNNPVLAIGNLMEIQTPIYVSGTVIDSITQLPIPGVEVTIGMRQTYTLADGSYFIIKDLGTYTFFYEKINYYSVLFSDTSSLSAGDTLNIDVSLIPEAFPVPYVTATVNCSVQSACLVEWGFPVSPFEIIYDDGTAEDLFVWATAFNENAVRFTPGGYPATVSGGRVYVGDGSFPNVYWMNTPFAILVYDEDAAGLPGNLLDSIGVSVNNYEWIDFDVLYAVIDSGDFFISMMQLNPSPYAAPIGIDMESPIVNRSYSKVAGGSWALSVYQDFMIRALIENPSTTNVDHYTIARMSDFNPDLGPATGVMTMITDTMAQAYVDSSFQFLPEAWYAYAIQTVYAGGSVSPWVYSNIVGMDKGKIVTFQIEDCNGNGIENTEILMIGEDWPYALLECVTDPSGTCMFDCVWVGPYDVMLYRYGYVDDEFDTYIANDTIFGITLDQKMYPSRNLWVDPVTATAYWDEAMITALYDNFDEVDFWFTGWQMTSYGVGWVQTDDGGSIGFFIPTNGSTYVSVNDNLAGPGNNGCCDLLITPELDLREADNYVLSFDSYFTGVLGQQATVEYTLDAGASWTVLHTLSSAAGVWEYLEIDLAAFSGSTAQKSIWFAFHADDGGGLASGWAIDNVDINAGPADLLGYDVFLDSAFMAYTDTTFYTYEYLSYGVSYTSCVAGKYICGNSEYVCADFTSAFLMSPYWLHGDTVNNDILLSWGIDTVNTPPELGFNIYRDSLNIAYVPYIGGDTIYYLDVAPDPMCYDYHVSTLYDLSTYTFPGDTGESQYTGPEEVCLVYGTFLPIGEDWSSGSFSSFWTPGQNWVINGQYGTPEPCAEFTWDPILTNYQQSLTSGYINGVYQETKDGPYIDGRFILEFDISLDDYSASGNEYFAVEVWSNGIWQRVKQFSNADGDFDWTNVEIDISDEAFGHMFKIRFMAEGAFSYDILSWFVDNVNIYRICYPPTDLIVYGIDVCTMELYWSPPITGGSVSGEWIMWDDGVNVDGIGLTGGGVFSVASHWDADMISQYDGMSITTIRFVPYANVVNTSFTLKVWKGANAGTLVYEQALASVVAGEWNEVALTTAVTLDVAQELWFGYTCDSPDGENPAGFDAGPAVIGYGDMITLDGIIWDPITNFGFDLNWNIHALVGNATDHSLVQMTYNEDLSVYNTPAGLPVESVGETSYNPIGLSVQAITGYRIYFNDDGAGYEYLELTQDTFYSHVRETPFLPDGLYCYYVKAVYEDCDADSDEACWLPSGIDYYGIENSGSIE